MTQQKMIVNRSHYCSWRFEGCGDDWDNFIDSYGFSPQFLIDGKTIRDVSLDDVFGIVVICTITKLKILKNLIHQKIEKSLETTSLIMSMLKSYQQNL